MIERNPESAFVYSRVENAHYRKFMSLEHIGDYFYYFSVINYMFLKGLIGLEDISDGNQFSFDKIRNIVSDPRFLGIDIEELDRDLSDRKKLVEEYCKYVARNLLVVLEDDEGGSYDLSDNMNKANKSMGFISFRDFKSKEYETNGYKTNALEVGEIAYLDFFRRSDDDLFLTYRALQSSTPNKVQLFGFW